MDKESIERKSADRPASKEPTEDGKRSAKTTAEVGAITKGSSGTPKARGDEEREADGRQVRESHEGGAAQRDNPADDTLPVSRNTSTGLPPRDVPQTLLDKLGEMHTAEKKLVGALPKMEAAANSNDLKTLLQIHLGETQGHVKALEEVAKSLKKELPAKECAPVDELIGETEKVIGRDLPATEEDASLIACAQKVEQFEIESYTKLCAEVEKMNWTHELAVLKSILGQEKLAHALLGQLAAGKSDINKLVEEASRNAALS